jgi:hypothetical protein
MLNLTPHAITIEREDGTRVTFPPPRRGLSRVSSPLNGNAAAWRLAFPL